MLVQGWLLLLLVAAASAGEGWCTVLRGSGFLQAGQQGDRDNGMQVDYLPTVAATLLLVVHQIITKC